MSLQSRTKAKPEAYRNARKVATDPKLAEIARASVTKALTGVGRALLTVENTDGQECPSYCSQPRSSRSGAAGLFGRLVTEALR